MMIILNYRAQFFVHEHEGLMMDIETIKKYKFIKQLKKLSFVKKVILLVRVLALTIKVDQILILQLIVQRQLMNSGLK